MGEREEQSRLCMKCDNNDKRKQDSAMTESD